MKKGTIVQLRDDPGWSGVVLAAGANVLLRWESGPLQGKEARVPTDRLRVQR